ncbi:MAG TPA: hypothetical protein VG605_21510 [Puia sp.]|nr:hypothetical protein [Puia sp.]
MKIGALGVFFIGLICTQESNAQDYQAVKGSSYAGAMSASDNPASILSTPYPWDITLLSVQEKNTTNAITFSNFSYLHHLHHGDTLAYNWTNGDKSRYAAVDFNVHLLNVRFNVGRKQAISFGANLRGYTSARAGKFNYNDSLASLNQFFSINEGTTFQGQLVSSSWIELYGTYSRTLIDDEKGRLNAGVTLRVSRGISGIYAQLNGGMTTKSVMNSLSVYTVTKGSAVYGYSNNYDLWHTDQSTSQNLKNFLTRTQGGAGIDIGFEYLVKPQYVHIYGEPDDYYDYTWKFGAALLDVGENVYIYGTQGKAVSNPNSNATDYNLNNKFLNFGTLAQFNDSLSTIVNSISTPQGKFRIYDPARFEFNVDRKFPQHFAVNADLTLNLGGSNKGKRLFTKDFTLLGITPRWETRNLGGYLPIEVTTDGRVWVGGAFKAGPLLLGVHNWANLFSKNKLQNGGFYVSLVIHPGDGFSLKEDKKYTCPKD